MERRDEAMKNLEYRMRRRVATRGRVRWMKDEVLVSSYTGESENESKPRDERVYRRTE